MVLLYIAHQRRKRAAGAAAEQQRLPPDGVMPAQGTRSGNPGPNSSAAASGGGLHVTSAPRADKHLDRIPAGGQAPKAEREPTPHDRKTRNELAVVLAVLVASLALSIPTGKDIFILGYIVAIAYAIRGPRRNNRPWGELGLKRGFLKDLRLVWYLAAIEAVLFQLAPPNFGLADVLGYYPKLVHHITGRLPVHLGSSHGIATLAGLLATVLILTLLEELVWRVTIQERLSWFIGTPAAILITSVLFASGHAVGAPAGVPVILLDVAGVFIDGILLGIIYAKTHNLALTWAIHFAGDALALIALLLIF